MNQILMNLLSNALKFTPRGGRVTLRVTKGRQTEEGIWLKFDVTDTGCGIAPENYGKIFQAFEQENSSVSQTYGGTGLGLSISKRFTEMMGGRSPSPASWGRGPPSRWLSPSDAWKSSRRGEILPASEPGGGRRPGCGGPLRPAAQEAGSAGGHPRTTATRRRRRRNRRRWRGRPTTSA